MDLKLKCLRSSGAADPLMQYSGVVIACWAEVVQEGFPSIGILDALMANASDKLQGRNNPWTFAVHPGHVINLTGS